MIEVVKSHIPPTLLARDGKWFIQIHNGNTITEAPCGAWFIAQLMTRVVLTELVLKASEENGHE